MAKKAQSQSKRPRGRPKGSSGFAVKDRETLEEVAVQLVGEPSLRRTDIYRKLGYSRDSEFHRLNGKWRKDKDELLREAQLRHDRIAELGWLGKIADGLSNLDGWAERFFNSAPVQALARFHDNFENDIERAARRKTALDELEQSPEPPVNVDDPGEVSAAIDRYVNREHKSEEQLITSFDPTHTVADLPVWQKLEVWSLLLHELALQARGNHDAQASVSRQDPVRSSNRRPLHQGQKHQGR